MQKTIAFIGAGNMGGAVAVAVSRAIGPENVIVFDPSAKAARGIADKCGCAVAATTEEAVKAAHFVMMAVKPQIFAPVLAGVIPFLGEGQVLTSLAASVSIAQIDAQLAEAGLAGYPVIRMLPNTPALVGKGLFLVCPNGSVSDELCEEYIALLREGGLAERVTEKAMNEACPVYSCSPAFTAMYIEALADGAVTVGVPRAKAIMYAAQSVMGAAALILETGEHPGAVKDAVCSPGGTTIVGVNELEMRGFRAAVSQAVVKSFERMMELEG